MKALCQSVGTIRICSQCNTEIPVGITRSCPAFIQALPPAKGGLGTKVADLITKLGYKKKCIPCQKREEKLNRFSNWLYLLGIRLWNALHRKPSKAKRRKQLAAQLALPSQENLDRKAAKDARRQALLDQQNVRPTH